MNKLHSYPFFLCKPNNKKTEMIFFMLNNFDKIIWFEKQVCEMRSCRFMKTPKPIFFHYTSEVSIQLFNRCRQCDNENEIYKFCMQIHFSKNWKTISKQSTIN